MTIPSNDQHSRERRLFSRHEVIGIRLPLQPHIHSWFHCHGWSHCHFVPFPINSSESVKMLVFEGIQSDVFQILEIFDYIVLDKNNPDTLTQYVGPPPLSGAVPLGCNMPNRFRKPSPPLSCCLVASNDLGTHALCPLSNTIE